VDFDIQTLYDAELTQDEEQFDAFQDALRERFARSPEWADVGSKSENPGFWAAQFVLYSYLHLGVPLAEVDADDADEVIYDIFPGEITLAQPEEAKNARSELIAFWRFLKREFGLENADTVLAYLDSMDPDEFTEAMLDPENCAGVATMASRRSPVQISAPGSCPSGTPLPLESELFGSNSPFSGS